MGYSAEVMARARRQLEADYAQRQNMAAARLEKAYKQVPRLQQIDSQMRRSMVLAAQAAFARGQEAKAIMEEDFKSTQEHGQWFARGGVQMTAIYHPAALLRDVSKRPETFEDLKSIQSKIRELCDHTNI